jgi:hypothetical protein
LFHAVDDRADQMRQTERLRHVGVHRSGDPSEIVEVFLGEQQRLQFVRFPSIAGHWHQAHADSSTLGESAEQKSLPRKLKKFSG